MIFYCFQTPWNSIAVKDLQYAFKWSLTIWYYLFWFNYEYFTAYSSFCCQISIHALKNSLVGDVLVGFFWMLILWIDYVDHLIFFSSFFTNWRILSTVKISFSKYSHQWTIQIDPRLTYCLYNIYLTLSIFYSIFTKTFLQSAKLIVETFWQNNLTRISQLIETSVLFLLSRYC